jgi:hypothetical protein
MQFMSDTNEPAHDLSLEQLLGAVDTPIEKIYVKPLNGYLYVKGLTGEERDEWEKTIVRGRGKKAKVVQNVRAHLLARCLVTRAGVPLMNPGLIARLGKVRADIIGPAYDLAAKLSGISDDDLDELEGHTSDGTNSATSSSS